MPENRHLRFLLRLLYAALALAGLWLCVRFLLPWLLPFLLAWGLDEFSVSASAVLATRRTISLWSRTEAGEVAAEAMALSSVKGIQGYLSSMSKQ